MSDWEPDYSGLAHFPQGKAWRSAMGLEQRLGNCARIGGQIAHPCPTCGAQADGECRLGAVQGQIAAMAGQMRQGPFEAGAGRVWQPWGLGGGEWKNPEVVTLCDADIERIARAVVRMLKDQTP